MPCPDQGAILVVEDPVIRRFVKTALGPGGRRVIESDVPHALRLLRAGSSHVYLLITNTPAVFAEFASDLRVLYLAASPDWDVAAQFRDLRVLTKPFGVAELRKAVEEL
jgi:CheY-like chemotaxis protein